MRATEPPSRPAARRTAGALAAHTPNPTPVPTKEHHP